MYSAAAAAATHYPGTRGAMFIFNKIPAGCKYFKIKWTGGCYVKVLRGAI